MDEDMIRYFEGKMSRQQSLYFLQMVTSNEQLKKQFIEYQHLYTLLQLVPEEKDQDRGASAYMRFTQRSKRKPIRRMFRRAIAYAASVALLVLITWVVSVNSAQQQVISGTNELYVPAGQRARLTLDDGTVVWLNAQSTLVYADNFSERKVTLTGEAFFNVADNPDKPFTVSVKNLNITVLGTEFNVSNYPENDYIQASLIEGGIKVWTEGGQEKILHPKEQLLYANGIMTVTPIEDLDYFLWKDGVYSFINEPFAAIIQRLERYYNVTVDVEDLPILDFEYTGKFRQQDGVDEILRIIQKIHPFTIEKKHDRIILRK